jgi:hypothetical protein
MKQEFKIGQIVKIIDIDNVDVMNENTDEQDIFLNDEYLIEDIEGIDDEQDLIVWSFRSKESYLIAAYRFVIIGMRFVNDGIK